MATTSMETSTVTEDPRVARSRARILAAATELLVEAGPRCVTVDAVAERSGVAKSTMYRHWPSVHELLADVIRTNMPEPAPVDVAAGFDRALRSWSRHAADALSAPEWARILPAVLELRAHSPEMAALLTADLDEKLTTIAAILDVGVREGCIPAGLDARAVMHVLIGPLVLATLSGDEDRLPQLAEYVVDRFLLSYAAAPLAAGGPDRDARGRRRRPGR